MARARLSGPLALLLGLSLAGCGAAPELALERTSAGITQGAPSASDAAVAGLRPRRLVCGASQAAEVLCTGSLVAPRVVLTAAHCLNDLAEQSRTLEDLEVFFGADIRGAGEVRRVIHARPHPGYVAATRENDVALLLLDRAATAAPLPLGEVTGGGSWVERTVRLVGFGMERAGAGQGLKRTGTARISAQDERTLRLAASPSLTCGGDSGGPILLDEGGGERVVAVVRSGDSACSQFSVGTRVQPHLASFIQPYLDAAGGLQPEQRPLVDPSADFCAQPCAEDAQCPTGMLCLSEPAGRQCGYPQLRGGLFGAACASDADCGGGTCASVGVGELAECRCFTRCSDRPRAPETGCAAGGFAPGAAWVLALGGLAWRRGRRVRA
jgi:hypothetical protein